MSTGSLDPRSDDVIRRLSPSTNVCDLQPQVRDYIRQVRSRGSRIGDLEVWIRKRRGGHAPRLVAVGPTLASVTDSALIKFRIDSPTLQKVRVSPLSFVQSAATRKLSQCKCGTYPQCEECVLMRLVVRLTDAMSTGEPQTATGRIQRDAVQSAAEELAAASPGGRTECKP